MDVKIDKISEISPFFREKDQTCSILTRLYKVLDLGKYSNAVSKLKQQGCSLSGLLYGLLLLRICGLTVYAGSKEDYWNLLSCRGKDTFYRYMNNPTTSWRKLLYRITLSFIKVCSSQKSDPSSSRPCCLIFDDTLLPKTGKKAEGITKVYDHVLGKMRLGYKLLGMVYFDGTSSILSDFSLHHEPGKKKDGGLTRQEKKGQYKKSRPDKSYGQIRKKELSMSKIESMKDMLSRAFKEKLHVNYVLMDSWFTSYDLINHVISLWKKQVHVIGRCKVDLTKYEIHGKKRTGKEIVLQYGRKAHYCRKTKSAYIRLDAKQNGIPVRLFLIRYRKHQQWTIILTTDFSLRYRQAFELYQIRWNIEVLWKDCKEYLELGKYQGRDLDGQIADCTIVFIIHQILTLEKRFSSYETFGEVFKEAEKEARMLTLWERILDFVYKMVNTCSFLYNEGDDVLIRQTVFDSFCGMDINQETHWYETIEKMTFKLF